MHAQSVLSVAASSCDGGCLKSQEFLNHPWVEDEGLWGRAEELEEKG